LYNFIAKFCLTIFRSTKQTDNTWFDVKLVIYNPSIADQGTYHLTASLGSEDLSLDFFIQVNSK